MKREFEKHQHLDRPKDAMMKVMPFGMVTIFISILVLAHIYAMVHLPGSPTPTV
jgi:hypothetical protein